MAKRFPYYERLSAKDKAIYRRSDDAPMPVLADAPALRLLARAVEEALVTGKRVRVARATQALADVLCTQLGVPKLKVRVREVRPQLEGAELHGLYTFPHDGRTPLLDVWMRTGAREDVVRFRTYLRTFLHELAHHLDVTLYGLTDSFHTAGFFRRESSLVRQVLGEAPHARAARRAEVEPVAVAPRRQLGLFDPHDD